MMNTSGGLEGISCTEAALLLEKRISEETLTDEELRAVEHHLDDCSKCRDFEKLTMSLHRFADELSEDEVSSAVSNVMANMAAGRAKESRNHVSKIAFAFAASIAAAALVGVIVKSTMSSGPDVAASSFECTPSDVTSLVQGVLMTYCDDRAPLAIIENQGEVRVSMRSGAVGLAIDPERPNRRKVTVETPYGKVRVKGTVFTVRVDEDGATVEVFRGVVEVFPDAKETGVYEVEAGYGLKLGERKAFELANPATVALRQKLKTGATGEVATAMDTREATRPVSLNEPSGPSGIVDSGAPATSEQSDIVSRRGITGANVRAAKSIDILIQDAQSCLIAQDWRCAEAKYQEVLKRYSGRPESLAALISLAKIELRHLGAPKKALAHYKTYQQRAPNGPLAEEALFGIADAYRRLDNEAKEEEMLRLFVERYPESSLSGKARARLRQID